MTRAVHANQREDPIRSAPNLLENVVFLRVRSSIDHPAIDWIKPAAFETLNACDPEPVLLTGQAGSIL
jgi:hypothetical protein